MINRLIVAKMDLPARFPIKLIRLLCLSVQVFSSSSLVLLTGCKTIMPSAPMPRAKIGIEVRSLRSGKVVYAHHADQYFVPGSTTKLFTAATALRVLKPSYQFETQVFWDNKDLYLKGSGDPSFSVHDLEDLAGQIKQLIKKPIRNIILDDSVFDRNYYPNGWMEEDYPKGYSAPISGINTNYNRLVVGFLPGKKIMIDPLTRFVKVEVKPSGYFKITGPGIDIEGQIPRLNRPSYKTYAIRDPIAWAGFLFKEALKRAGVSVTGKAQAGLVPAGLETLTSSFSPYLSEILIGYLKFSNNLGNEALVKTLGAGNFENGLKIIENSVGFPIADGSGLSRLNQVTPTQMTNFLVSVADNFYLSPEFITALPIGGQDGLLKNRFKSDYFNTHVRAKTGSMTGINCLAGYFRKQNGEILAFSIFANELQSSSAELQAWLEGALSKL